MPSSARLSGGVIVFGESAPCTAEARLRATRKCGMRAVIAVADYTRTPPPRCPCLDARINCRRFERAPHCQPRPLARFRDVAPARVLHRAFSRAKPLVARAVHVRSGGQTTKATRL